LSEGSEVDARDWLPQPERSGFQVLSGDGKGSLYESLSSDHRRAHGLAPSFWIFDELAKSKDRTLLDGLMTAAGKRKHTLGIIISTQAPKDDHALSQLTRGSTIIVRSTLLIASPLPQKS
jgi:hypothetical protein